MLKLKELQAKHEGLWKEVNDLLLAGTMDEVYETKNAELDDLTTRIKALKALAANAPPDSRKGFDTGGPDDPAPEQTPEELKAADLRAVHVMTYGDLDASQDRIMKQVYGEPYMSVVTQQDEEYKTYVRTGREPSDRVRAERQLWDVNDVMDMLKDGMYVDEIKATMVEGTGRLGGYAVPPQRARAILQESMGLVAIRQAGALVMRTSSNMLEWLKITGATKGTYPSAMRGSWGGETQSPEATNLTYGLEQIPVHLYTYKVPISQSLLDDASNIMPTLNRKMAETMAIDENEEFTHGTGEKAPLGIMPGDAPDPGITALGNVTTSSVSASFNVADLKAVRRGLASVYRIPGRAGYIFNSDTADFIEQMQDSEGRFYFESVGLGERIFGSATRETESMPSRASSAYPVIYGDAIGYAIVERLGLSIVRFQDSNTGINMVEFHLRRRIGGRVVEPYRFSVMQCAA